MTHYDESGRPCPDEDEVEERIIKAICKWLREGKQKDGFGGRATSDDLEALAVDIERGEWK